MFVCRYPIQFQSEHSQQYYNFMESFNCTNFDRMCHGISHMKSYWFGIRASLFKYHFIDFSLAFSVTNWIFTNIKYIFSCIYFTLDSFWIVSSKLKPFHWSFDWMNYDFMLNRCVQRLPSPFAPSSIGMQNRNGKICVSNDSRTCPLKW